MPVVAVVGWVQGRMHIVLALQGTPPRQRYCGTCQMSFTALLRVAATLLFSVIRPVFPILGLFVVDNELALSHRMRYERTSESSLSIPTPRSALRDKQAAVSSLFFTLGSSL